MADDRIRVAARVRPLALQEEERGEHVVVTVQDAHTITLLPCAQRAGLGGPASGSASGGNSEVSEKATATAFSFDVAFNTKLNAAGPCGFEDAAGQEKVYEEIGRPVLLDALGGVNGCLFAYGQTGSGKTFSMFGTEEIPGVLPRLAAELLDAKRQAEEADDGEEITVSAAFLELYNENLVDLLSNSREPLRLFESSREGVLVPGLSECEVSSRDEFGSLLELAEQNRTVGATCMNERSSRSHALTQLRVKRSNSECTAHAKIHLIDLAGSERQKKAKNEGTRMKEGIQINVSLSTLGLVISRLSEMSQGKNHCSVPFRDSKLTFLLKDSLSGNSRTQVLIALSPSSASYEETLSTLRFAQSVKRIRTRPVADVLRTTAQTAADMQVLQAEVVSLRAELATLRGDTDTGSAIGSLLPPPPPRIPLPLVPPSAPAALADNSQQGSGCGGLERLAGCYLSPTGRQISVDEDGGVQWAGGNGHYPIRISLQLVEGDSSSEIVRLEAEGDPDYRYVLVAESDAGLVWRHESNNAVAVLGTGTDLVQWQRVPGPGGRTSSKGSAHSSVLANGTAPLPDDAMDSAFAAAATPTFAAALDPCARQAFRALMRNGGESPSLTRIAPAAVSLLQVLAGDSCSERALEAIDALGALCADIDEANALFDRGAPPRVGLVRFDAPRLEATWLAPEPNPEMAARELLRVKVLRQAGGGPPRVGQVWSLAEFARRLETMRGRAEGVSAGDISVGDVRGAVKHQRSDCNISAGSPSRGPCFSRSTEGGPQSPPSARRVRSGSCTLGVSGPPRVLQRQQSPLPGSPCAPTSPPGDVSTRSLPVSVLPRACSSTAVPVAVGPAILPLLSGRYLSQSGVNIQVQGDSIDFGGRQLQLVCDHDKVVLRSLDDPNYGPYCLLSREPNGLLLWVRDGLDTLGGISGVGSEVPITWSPLELTSPGCASTIFDDDEVGGPALHRFTLFSPPQGNAVTPPRPPSVPPPRMPQQQIGGRGHNPQWSPKQGTAMQRPQSADPSRSELHGSARVRATDRSRRRSPTPSRPGAQRRAQSAASVRGAKGSTTGDGCVVARAIDKNSLRLRNGRIFIDALAAWRAAHSRTPTSLARRLLPGMCAVYIRKRPMFERDARRSDFDVLTVVAAPIREDAVAEDVVTYKGQEIVHHACMFEKDLSTPFVSHTQFPFDGVFDVGATNDDVYRHVGRPLLENALDGGLATLFVFGQTGSGKTHTMEAIERAAADELFSRLEDGAEVSVACFELAGRKALDLLTEQKAEIRLREESDGSFRPHDHTEKAVIGAEDLLCVIGEAAGRRATDATTVNDTSSRSHAICRVSIWQRGIDTMGCRHHERRGTSALVGRLLLVDCAGTERSKDSLFFMGTQIKESAQINSSLFALKDCIRFRQAAIHRQGGMPQEGQPLKLPSVRGALLTKVLAESLISATAQLAVVATVSPNATDAEHTIDTLRTVYMLSGRGEARVVENRQALD